VNSPREEQAFTDGFFRDNPHEPAAPGSWRVFSDGTPDGTRIISPKGEELAHVKAMTYYQDATGMGQLTIEILPAEFALKENDQIEIIFECPKCGESKVHDCNPPF
jgi:hypothetical protein